MLLRERGVTCRVVLPSAAALTLLCCCWYSLSSMWICISPTTFHYLWLFKLSVIMAQRVWVFARRRMLFFLLSLCYVCSLAGAVQICAFPTSIAATKVRNSWAALNIKVLLGAACSAADGVQCRLPLRARGAPPAGASTLCPAGACR